MRNHRNRLRLATAQQSLKIDQISQEEHDLSGEGLMNEAGAAAAKFIETEVLPNTSADSILIACGPGNNGGDGIVVARELMKAGFGNLLVLTLGDEISPLQEKQFSSFNQFEIELIKFRGTDIQRELLEHQSLIIDAIFGVGLSREVQGDYATLVNWINDSVLPVVSLDVPSGLNSDTGRKMGTCIEAQWTVSFGLAKPGFYMWDGPKACGEIVVENIGFPESVLESVATTHELFDKESAKTVFPKGSETTNKSKQGKVFVVAGKRGMWGAGVLASKGAYRAGCGYVHFNSFDDPAEIVNELPEALTGVIDKKFKPDSKFTYVVGPGLGVNDKTKSFIESLRKVKVENVVLDADALTVVANEELYPLPSSWVVTPHSGELSRILGNTAEEVDQDRFQSVKRAQELLGCHVLLKGYQTVVQTGGVSTVIQSGNSALATAGSGDVLAGVIAGLLAQGVSPEDAACLGAYLHGKVADNWVGGHKAKSAMMASDIIDGLPEAMGQISE